MLYIFYGPDTFSRGEAVKELQRNLDDDGMLSTNTVSLDGSRVTYAELIAICNTIPFLSTHRLVIATGLLARAHPPAAPSGRVRNTARHAQEPASGGGFMDLPEAVPQMPSTTVLLLLEGAIRADVPLFQALRPLGETRPFPQLGAAEIADWVRQRARSLDATFEPRAVQALVELSGANLWSLAGEVDKLSLYASGRPVREEDVRRLVAAAQESNVFALVDAVLDGRLDVALNQLRLLLQGGAAGPYLITMIARQYRQILLIQDLTRSGMPAAAIMRSAEIRSENALRRLRLQAQRWSPARLQAAYERILTADRSIKRGEASEDVALELLVGDLTTASS